jgi:hypothetical protein
MHVAAELGRGGQRLVGREVLERRVVVFGDQQRRHQITPLRS